MANRRVMTARRRAALRKAQLASARKRKGRGAKRAVKRANRRSVSANKKLYAAQHYRKPGGYHKQMKHLRNSQGVYATNVHGKKIGSKAKKLNKAAYYLNYSPVAMGVSKARGKRAAKKRKR